MANALSISSQEIPFPKTRFSPEPPGPRGVPFLGSLPSLRRDPLGFFTGLSESYGGIARFSVFQVPVWLVTDPAAAEEVLVSKARHFVKGRGLQVGRPIFGDGLLTSEGEKWRRQRKLVAPAFHHQRLAAYERVMADFTTRFVEGLRAGETRDLHRDLMRLTLEIVAKCLFDADVSKEAKSVGDALAVAIREFPKLLNPARRFALLRLPFPAGLELRRSLRTLDTVIAGVIASRKASGEDRGDLLSMLLASRDEDGEGMPDAQVRDEVMTLFLAGHETTALSLVWTLALLAENPVVERRLARELAGFSGDTHALPYLDAVVKESLRLYPPAWAVGRVAAEDVAIGGFRAAKGTSVILSPWVAQRNAGFFADPLAFRPERWQTGEAQGLPRMAYFPFGAGPRSCIGAGFAALELKTILRTLLSKARFVAIPGQDLTPQPSITLRPRGGFRVVVTAVTPALPGMPAAL
ncbi:MAG: cytochrome P450 [Acidobacteria bacterium]|nr:cytochrome P450 [Acidobacteriota bacterium]